MKKLRNLILKKGYMAAVFIYLNTERADIKYKGFSVKHRVTSINTACGFHREEEVEMASVSKQTN